MQPNLTMLINETIPNILVVDDRPENLRTIERVLQSIPVNLHLIDSGKQALTQLLYHDYALAILDVQMPDLNGFELADLIIHNKETEHIPIIFVSANNREAHHIEQAYELGAVDYLVKPFNYSQLIAKISVFLKLNEHRQAAKNFECQLLNILNHVADGWWQWEIGNEYQFHSESFKKILGYENNEIPNSLSAWQNLVLEEDLDLFYKKLQAHIKDQKPFGFPMRFRHRDNSIKWLYCQGVSFHNKYQSPLTIIGTYHNITPLKNTEALLRKSNQELESFAYVVSHDLRAPLRGILNLTEWIEDECKPQLSETAHEYFDKLRNLVERMDNLINGILAYSRVNNQLSLESVNIKHVIDEVIEFIAPPDNCQIHTNIHAGNLKVPLVQFKQVIANLLNNAIKYNDKTEIIITISVTQHDYYYEFAIQDNGPGIDPAFHNRIFELFQTLHSRDEIESTGVGLTIVKKIIEQHGGEIWLDSKPGNGSIFSFTWPKQ
ncbi:MAG: hypothetical protein Tsb005_00120 [Gammaproteobacteria bacterium]